MNLAFLKSTVSIFAGKVTRANLAPLTVDIYLLVDGLLHGIPAPLSVVDKSALIQTSLEKFSMFLFIFFKFVNFFSGPKASSYSFLFDWIGKLLQCTNF